MAWCDLHFRGTAVLKHTNMYVILPEGEGPFPVLYLLHGLSDDYSVWMRRTRIEVYAEKYPLIIVMPDGHRSWYVNDPRLGGLAYEDLIVKDVVGLVDRTFPTVRSREGRAVAGLSMGGYGAIMLGLRHQIGRAHV
jgi:putative tributyrin esterase